MQAAECSGAPLWQLWHCRQRLSLQVRAVLEQQQRKAEPTALNLGIVVPLGQSGPRKRGKTSRVLVHFIRIGKGNRKKTEIRNTEPLNQQQQTQKSSWPCQNQLLLTPKQDFGITVKVLCLCLTSSIINVRPWGIWEWARNQINISASCVGAHHPNWQPCKELEDTPVLAGVCKDKCPSVLEASAVHSHPDFAEGHSNVHSKKAAAAGGQGNQKGINSEPWTELPPPSSLPRLE